MHHISGGFFYHKGVWNNNHLMIKWNNDFLNYNNQNITIVNFLLFYTPFIAEIN